MGFFSITASGVSLPIFAIFAIIGCAKGVESLSPAGADDSDGAGTAGNTSAGANALGGSLDSGAGAPSSAGGNNSAAGASDSRAGSGGTSIGGTSGSADASRAGTSSGGKAGSPAQGGNGGQGAQLFSDDFEDGNADGWTVSGGTWAVIKDGSQAYAQQAKGTSSNVLISASGAAAWTDQVIGARLKVLSFGGQSTSYFAAIYARYNGTDYYALTLRQDGHLAIRKDKATLGNAVDAGIVVGTWYTLRFEVVGTSLKAYVNGVLEDSVTDSSLASGGIALSAVNATAEFDDIKVTLP